MSESYTCGDPGALVAYVYDECEPVVRKSIDAHLTKCVSCSREIEGLGRTRRQLGAWTPPIAELGFQMPARVLERTRPWWSAPLPAWAQAAAALLIFGAGLLMGVSRAPTDPGSVASTSPPAAAAASRNDLAQLEQRLRAEMTRLRAAAPVATQTDAAPAAAQASAGDDAIMRRVEERIAESEKGLRTELTLRAVDLRRDFETVRRVDLASVRESLGQIQGVTNTEIRQQREAIDRLSNFVLVSQQGR